MMMEKDEKGARRYPVSWWRTHTEVKVWAYILYCPEGYAILETWEEFSAFLAAFRIKTLWWYNAPFDFAATDAAKLSRDWKYTHERRPALCEFSELASPFGARYSMKENHPIDPPHDFNPRTKKRGQTVTHYDLRNLLKGGLAKLLETFDVHDKKTGEAIRKREMDYQSANHDSMTKDDLLYMIDDARGLWWLIQTFGEQLANDYGVEIRGTKPDVMTASGLAKKLLLRKMYPQAHTDHGASVLYKRYHPISKELDKIYRRGRILAGGLVMVNPHAKGKYLKSTPEKPLSIFRYDYNNHYGAALAAAPDITGYPRVYDGRCAKDKESDVRVFEVTNLHAMLREGFIPAWLNPIEHKVTSEVTVMNWRDGSVFLFDFELDELGNWYRIDECEVYRTWLFNGTPCDGFREFVMEHYSKKAAAKKAGDKPRHELEKLLNNGATGKFSQNPTHPVQERVMHNDGVVRFDTTDEPDEIDEAGIMNIVQGAYITALGRTILRRSCRRIAFLAGKKVDECILYTDTDSIHTSVPFSEVSAYELGWLKQENEKPITEAIYMAPKTYAELNEDESELHCKGINVSCLYEALRAGESLSDVYRAGREYLSRSAINVRGGKAILPMPKAVCRKIEGGIENDETYF